jgi:hypothetical protein
MDERTTLELFPRRLIVELLNSPSPELRAMQDAIYREKILRARHQTPAQRLADVFELTNAVFARMLDGAMWQAGTTNSDQGWEIVRKRLDRLRRIHDAGRFFSEPPAHRE